MIHPNDLSTRSVQCWFLGFRQTDRPRRDGLDSLHRQDIFADGIEERARFCSCPFRDGACYSIETDYKTLILPHQVCQHLGRDPKELPLPQDMNVTLELSFAWAVKKH